MPDNKGKKNIIPVQKIHKKRGVIRREDKAKQIRPSISHKTVCQNINIAERYPCLIKMERMKTEDYIKLILGERF